MLGARVVAKVTLSHFRLTSVCISHVASFPTLCASSSLSLHYAQLNDRHRPWRASNYTSTGSFNSTRPINARLLTGNGAKLEHTSVHTLISLVFGNVS